MALDWLHRKSEAGEDVCCCPECETEVDPKLTYCTACGYDIVKQAKTDLTQPPHGHLA